MLVGEAGGASGRLVEVVAVGFIDVLDGSAVVVGALGPSSSTSPLDPTSPTVFWHVAADTGFGQWSSPRSVRVP
jgi:hypothetical protein